MKKTYILLCALAALAAASCTEKEELAPSFTGEKVTREFSTVLTKTSLDSNGKTVLWEDGDAISIFDGKDNNRFDIKNNTGSSATFSGEVDGGATEFYAVYPYADGNGLAGSILTATVPAEQTLKEGSFQSGAAVAVAYTKSSTLDFYQATAVLGITLADYMTNVESIELKGNNNEVVAGAVNVTLNASGEITDVTPAGTSKAVTLTGSFEENKTYYLSFIPRNFSAGLTVTVTYGGGHTAVATSGKTLNTEKGKIYPIADFRRVELPVASVAAKTSFAYGESKNIDVTLTNVTSPLTIDDSPAGWDVSWVSDHFVVTAPALVDIQATPQTVAPAGVIVATISNDKYSGKLEVPVRLYGINSLDDLKALQDNNVMDTHANAAPYLVNAGGVEELTLNTDLTLVTNDLKSKAIALHHNAYPINGNGRTVTYDNVTVAAWPAGFVQNLQNNVHDINFAGSIKNTAASAKIGALAARGYNISGDEIVITNVTSDVDITWTAAASNTCIGGLVGWMDDSNEAGNAKNKSITFVNCTVNGDIAMNGEVLSAGGILGQGEKKGTVSTAYTTFNGCTYTGQITYTPDATQGRNTRIGGIVGNSERQLKVINTISAGRIDVYLDNKKFGTNGAQAIGGFFGRSAAQATVDPPVYMDFYLDNCSTSTNIYVWGTNASEWKNAFQIRGYGLCKRSGPDASGNIAVTGGASIHYDYYVAP